MSFDTNLQSAEQNPQAQNQAVFRYSEAERQDFLDALLRDGFCIMRGHLPVELVQAWRRAFLPILSERIANGSASARGDNRYYLSLPFTQPFANPMVYEDVDILDILTRAAGGELVMPELAVDTPLKDSDYQVIHRDHVLRSPDLPNEPPTRPFQFAVNFPLVDVTPENGPFEVIPGTHLWTDEECREKVKGGKLEGLLEPLEMSVGDVMLRDVRALHRGTPNRTETPRPMVVVGYNRLEHRRPQLRIFIPKDVQAQLSPSGQRLLRLNPVVESLSDAEQGEAYSQLYFLEED